MAYSSAGGAAMFGSEEIVRKTASEIRDEQQVSSNLTINTMAYKALAVNAVKAVTQEIYAKKIQKAS